MTVYGLQFDTTGSLPFTPALRAFYINGRYASKPQYGPGRVYIDVLATDPAGAFWLDVEAGDATPGSVPGWLDARKAAGLGVGGIYCNRSTLPQVVAAASGRRFALWLATLDGTIPGAAAIELADTATLCAVQAYPAAMVGGINVDISVVVDRAYWGRAL
jgi:hypothetical protein